MPYTTQIDLPNAVALEGDVVSGGQPTEDTLRAAAEVGYASVLNLCDPSELAFDERATVERLGMRYLELPIRGAQDLTPEHARSFDAALRDAPRPLIVHCGSGNRVGALFALRAHVCEDATVTESLRLGRNAGLTGLERTVRAKLGGT